MSASYSATGPYITTPMNMPYNVPMSLQTSPQIKAPPAEMSLTNPPLMRGIFGPLGKQYCIWFYLLSVVGFVMLAMVLVSGFALGISKGKSLDHYLYIVLGSVVYAIVYFQNRLLYNMCSNTL